jgi:hypothetical protein
VVFDRSPQVVEEMAEEKAIGAAWLADLVRLMQRLPFVVDFFIGRELRDRVELPDYGF